MTYLPRVAAANGAEWVDLATELDRWAEAGHVAQLWWRDDDAVAPSLALDRLFNIAGAAPLALAVIPADATPELARALSLFPQVTVLHHGWCHVNHATESKSSEYPADRHPVDVADEFDEGRQRLRMLFGPRALPLFVPPWNRFAERFVPLLVEARLTALSQLAPRSGGPPAGIRVLDVDVDVVAWRAGRGFIGEREAIARLVAALRREREGARGAVGLLTHHLVTDAATEDFLFRLGDVVAGHPGAGWVDIRELLVAP